MDELTVEDLDLKGKSVPMHVDFNVPLEDGRVVNDKPIRAALPTINYINNNGSKPILMSHLNQPKGKHLPKMSLEPCVTFLNALHRMQKKFFDYYTGSAVDRTIESLGEYKILLQNLRYYYQVTNNELDFTARVANLPEFGGNSSIVDSLSTRPINNITKMLSWYDNERGYYSSAMDFTEVLIKH
jgi:phosphoglycerate kinase